MKPTIDKSNLMRRAWNIFRGNNPYSHSFSAALRRAWEVEKETIAYMERKAAEAAEAARWAAIRADRRNAPVEVSDSFMAGCAEYYRNARPGQYMGD